MARQGGTRVSAHATSRLVLSGDGSPIRGCDFGCHANYLGPAVISIVPFVNSERMCATRCSRAGRRWDWRVRLRFDLVPRATGWGTGTRLLRCGLPLAERRIRHSSFLFFCMSN